MLAFAVAAALLLPAAAQAGTVAVDRLGDAKYRAAGGETNTLTATVLGTSSMPDEPLRYVVALSDSTAPIYAGPGCQQQGADTVVCPGVYSVALVDLADGDDSAVLDLPEQSGRVRGGAGNDRLTVTGSSELSGGPGNDVLTGSRAEDQLFGGGGRDELHGGGGGDYLTDGDRNGAADADVLDAGGQGCLDYSSRRRSVRVDLPDPGPDGEPGEGDIVSGFTQVAGGHGDDVLVGTRAAEQFDGGGGADRIYARGGDDEVLLRGREFVAGGPGNDLVRYASTGCGLARKDFGGPGAWLSQSCERFGVVDFSECGDRVVVRPRPVSVSRSGRLLLRIRIRDPLHSGPPCSPDPCRLRLTVSYGRRPYRRFADLHPKLRGHGGAVPIQLPGALARRAQHRPVRLRARLAGPDDCGGRWSEAWRFDVTVPG